MAVSKKTKIRKGWIWFFAVLLVLLAGLCIFMALSFSFHADIDLFEKRELDTTTRFYCYEADGSLLELSETLHGEKKIQYCALKDTPDYLGKAFVAIEDKRYFLHDGVDWVRTAAAAGNQILGLSPRFGASTITQQVVKNVTGETQVTFKRKMQEILWALDLERNFSKDEILEKYLNVINLGQGCYGVASAAQLYFSKKPSELTLSECATLAAITNNPSYYDPILHPDNTLYRRNLILAAMKEQNIISEKEYEESVSEPISLDVNEEMASYRVNSWYIDMAVEDVIADLRSVYGYSAETASRMVYNGGLRIELAMDAQLQSIVEDYYRESTHFTMTGDPQAQSGLILIDPYTGNILAVAGAVGEKSANRIQNYATTVKRPSGSVIKPLSVYAPALEEGLINWASVYDDVPVSFDGESMWPHNADRVYRGLVNVNYALTHSLNTVPVKILAELGNQNSFNFLYDTLGIHSLVKSLEVGARTITDCAPAALALGQQNYGVTLREIASAYSIFPGEGSMTASRSYLRVTDAQGRELLTNEIKSRYAISPENACIMTKMMQNVIRDGTASPITLDERVEVAGKTGTSQNSCDKWFVAYTPFCVCGVWYGYEYPAPVEGAYKNTYLRVWDDVMQSVTDVFLSRGEERTAFAPCDGVIRAVFCRDSGEKMTEACCLDPRQNRAETGWFESGTEPAGPCRCHVYVDYDTQTGGVADENCPDSFVEKVGMITRVRSFPTEVEILDAQYVYRKLPAGVPMSQDPRRPFFEKMLDNGEYCGISEGEVQFNRGCTGHFDFGKWLESRIIS